MRNIIYITLSFLLLASCERPDYVLSKSDMEQALYDYHLTQAMVSNLSSEDRYKAEMYMNAVYEKNGITKEQFDSSIVWYNRHTEDLEDIYDNLHDRFTIMNEEIQLQTGSNEMITMFSESGDTVNIWNGKQLFLLRNNGILCKETFTIKADTSFHQGDKFLLKANGQLINEDKNSRAFRLVMCLAVRYTDGKVISTVIHQTRTDSRQLTLNTDKEKQVEELFGYFYYNGTDKERNFAVINGIQLIKMHTEIPQTIQKVETEEVAPTIITEEPTAPVVTDSALTKTSEEATSTPSAEPAAPKKKVRKPTTTKSTTSPSAPQKKLNGPIKKLDSRQSN